MRKNWHKVLSLGLAMVMAFSMAVPAYAAEPPADPLPIQEEIQQEEPEKQDTGEVPGNMETVTEESAPVIPAPTVPEKASEGEAPASDDTEDVTIPDDALPEGAESNDDGTENPPANNGPFKVKFLEGSDQYGVIFVDGEEINIKDFVMELYPTDGVSFCVESKDGLHVASTVDYTGDAVLEAVEGGFVLSNVKSDVEMLVKYEEGVPESNVSILADNQYDMSAAGDGSIVATLNGSTLTIVGSGAMKNYDYRNSAVYAIRGSVTRIILDDRITSIGNYAFTDFTALTAVEGGAGVTSIGAYGFRGCSILKSVNFPSVRIIGSYGFGECGKLGSNEASDGNIPIEFPELVSAGDYAFYKCNWLEELSVPKLESIGTMCFMSACVGNAHFPALKRYGAHAFVGRSDVYSFTFDELEDCSDFLINAMPKCMLISMPNLTNISYSGAPFDNIAVNYGSATGAGELRVEWPKLMNSAWVPTEKWNIPDSTVFVLPADSNLIEPLTKLGYTVEQPAVEKPERFVDPALELTEAILTQDMLGKAFRVKFTSIGNGFGDNVKITCDVTNADNSVTTVTLEKPHYALVSDGKDTYFEIGPVPLINWWNGTSKKFVITIDLDDEYSSKVTFTMNTPNHGSMSIANSWDISATENDHVMALWSGNTLYISGTGRMKDFEWKYDSRGYGYSTAPYYSTVRKKTPNIAIDDGVTYLGNNAFRWNLCYTGIVSGGNGITEVGSYVIESAKNISFTLPNLMKANYQPFSGWENCISMDFPKLVSNDGTFIYDFDVLTTLNVPNLESSANGFVEECPKLASLSFPNLETVTTEKRAFIKDCKSLQSLSMPKLAHLPAKLTYSTPAGHVDCSGAVTAEGTSYDGVFGYGAVLKEPNFSNLQSIKGCFIYGSVDTLKLPKVTEIDASGVYSWLYGSVKNLELDSLSRCDMNHLFKKLDSKTTRIYLPSCNEIVYDESLKIGFFNNSNINRKNTVFYIRNNTDILNLCMDYDQEFVIIDSVPGDSTIPLRIRVFSQKRDEIIDLGTETIHADGQSGDVSEVYKIPKLSTLMPSGYNYTSLNQITGNHSIGGSVKEGKYVRFSMDLTMADLVYWVYDYGPRNSVKEPLIIDTSDDSPVNVYVPARKDESTNYTSYKNIPVSFVYPNGAKRNTSIELCIHVLPGTWDTVTFSELEAAGALDAILQRVSIPDTWNVRREDESMSVFGSRLTSSLNSFWSWNLSNPSITLYFEELSSASEHTSNISVYDGDTLLQNYSVMRGDAITAHKALVKPGYIFKGWASEKDGPVTIAPEEVITADKAQIDLYAVWEFDYDYAWETPFMASVIYKDNMGHVLKTFNKELVWGREYDLSEWNPGDSFLHNNAQYDVISVSGSFTGICDSNINVIVRGRIDETAVMDDLSVKYQIYDTYHKTFINLGVSTVKQSAPGSMESQFITIPALESFNGVRENDTYVHMYRITGTYAEQSAKEGDKVRFYMNSDAVITYWVSIYDENGVTRSVPSETDGLGDASGTWWSSVYAGLATYKSWTSNIRYHANYPDGYDPVYTMRANCRVDTKSNELGDNTPADQTFSPSDGNQQIATTYDGKLFKAPAGYEADYSPITWKPWHGIHGYSSKTFTCYYYRNADGTSAVGPNINPTYYNRDMDVYMNWKPIEENKNTISFYDGDELIYSKSNMADGETIHSPILSKDGQILKGWRKSTSADLIPSNHVIEVKGNSSYYAVWMNEFGTITLSYEYDDNVLRTEQLDGPFKNGSNYDVNDQIDSEFDYEGHHYFTEIPSLATGIVNDDVIIRIVCYLDDNHNHISDENEITVKIPIVDKDGNPVGEFEVTGIKGESYDLTNLIKDPYVDDEGYEWIIIEPENGPEIILKENPDPLIAYLDDNHNGIPDENEITVKIPIVDKNGSPVGELEVTGEKDQPFNLTDVIKDPFIDDDGNEWIIREPENGPEITLTENPDFLTADRAPQDFTIDLVTEDGTKVGEITITAVPGDPYDLTPEIENGYADDKGKEYDIVPPAGGNTITAGSINSLTVNPVQSENPNPGEKDPIPPTALDTIVYEFYKDKPSEIAVPIQMNDAKNLIRLRLGNDKMPEDAYGMADDAIILSPEYLMNVEEGAYRLLPTFDDPAGTTIPNLVVKVYESVADRMDPCLFYKRILFDGTNSVLKYYEGKGDAYANDVLALVIDDQMVTPEGTVMDFTDENVNALVSKTPMMFRAVYSLLASDAFSAENGQIMLDGPFVSSMNLAAGDHLVGAVFDNTSRTVDVNKVVLTIPKKTITITLEFKTPDGATIAVKEVSGTQGESYDLNKHVPATIAGSDGKTYVPGELADAKGTFSEDGVVEVPCEPKEETDPGTDPVKPTGDATLTVKFVNPDGRTVRTFTIAGKDGDAYDVSEQIPALFVGTDGKAYKAEVPEDATGFLKGNKTLIVNCVRKTGSVTPIEPDDDDKTPDKDTDKTPTGSVKPIIATGSSNETTTNRITNNTKTVYLGGSKTGGSVIYHTTAGGSSSKDTDAVKETNETKVSVSEKTETSNTAAAENEKGDAAMEPIYTGQACGCECMTLVIVLLAILMFIILLFAAWFIITERRRRDDEKREQARLYTEKQAGIAKE